MAAAEKILIRAPNWLGDAVMAIPAMAAVRRAYRDCALTLAAAPSIAPLFHEITPVAPDQILTVDKTTETATLRAAGAGRAILFPNSFRTAWGSRQAGIRERWGYGTHGRSLILTRAVRRPRHTVHQAEYYLHLVRELGIETPEGPPLARIEISEPTRRRVLELLEQHRLDTSAPLVGIAPGAAYGHAKRWPPERAAELAGRLTARGASIVLVGAAGDRGAGREIESSVPAGVRIVNLIGRTDLRLFAGLLAACHAFVSNDSGAMHLAAAAGVPVVAIFGPTDERVTAPLGDHDVIIHQVFCRPCMLRDCPIDHRCMRGIGVDVVFDAVSRRLDRRARPVEDPGA